jgi:predicted transcriptional regulator
MARQTKALPAVSRRERQILDVLYTLERGTASEVLEQLPDPPSYSAVRATLRILEDKGHVRHIEEGNKYIYVPTIPREHARMSALRHLVQTFFNGSVSQAVSALVDHGGQLSKEELAELSDLVERAKREGR